MNTSTINNQLNYLDCFIGTFSCDKIPTINELPAALVINTDPSYKPGEHWTAIYIDKNGYAEYFDSYGLPPLNNEILTFLNNNSRRWCHSTQMLQSIDSITCGHYCVIYIKLRCWGYSFCKFINLFTTSTYINDEIVQQILEEINGNIFKIRD